MRPSICSTRSPASTASATSSVFGAGQYAMRLWLDPQKLQARKLVPSRRHQRRQSAEPIDRAPDSSASRRSRTARRSNTRSTCRASSTMSPSSRTSSSRRTHGSGRITRLRDVATRRARRAAVQPDLQARRPAVGRARHLPASRGQRARRRQARREAHAASCSRRFRRA